MVDAHEEHRGVGLNLSLEDKRAFLGLGPGRYCMSRQRTHREPSFLEFNGIL